MRNLFYNDIVYVFLFFIFFFCSFSPMILRLQTNLQTINYTGYFLSFSLPFSSLYKSIYTVIVSYCYHLRSFLPVLKSSLCFFKKKVGAQQRGRTLQTQGAIEVVLSCRQPYPDREVEQGYGPLNGPLLPSTIKPLFPRTALLFASGSMKKTIPPKYRGVWQRTSIERPTGVLEDNTTAVFWVQAAGLFTDIRIPKRTQRVRQPISEILKQRASGGFVEIEEKSEGEFNCILKWNCELDFHPPCDVEDIGGCTFLTRAQAVKEGSRAQEGNLENYADLPTMIEKGLPPLDYREVWVKRDSGKHQSAFILDNEVPRRADGCIRKGIWLISGDFWSCALGRYKGGQSIGSRIASAKADSLGELFDRWGLDESSQRNAAVEFEAYVGKIVKKDGKVSFVILHSTRPDLEAATFLELPGVNGSVRARNSIERRTGSVVVRHQSGITRIWTIVEWGHEGLFGWKAGTAAAL